jgi:hypothetical protein
MEAIESLYQPATQARDCLHNYQNIKRSGRGNNKKPTNKAVYLASTIGLTITAGMRLILAENKQKKLLLSA